MSTPVSRRIRAIRGRAARRQPGGSDTQFALDQLDRLQAAAGALLDILPVLFGTKPGSQTEGFLRIGQLAELLDEQGFERERQKNASHTETSR